MSLLRHYLWYLISGLYLSQYIIIGFITVAVIAILREQGASLAQLSIINAIMLPMALKFLWAPAVDRFYLGNRGHYRNWLLSSQVLMLISLIVVSQIDPITQLSALFLLLLLLMFAVATQDLAVDGLACLIIPKAQRHRVNAIQLISGMVGNLLGGGLVLLFYNTLQWQLSVLILVIVTFVVVLLLYFFKEPEHKLLQQKIKLPWRRLWQFWQGQSRWLILLTVYPFGISLGFALITPLLVDSGWQMQSIGTAMKIYGSIIGLLSALLSAWIIRLLGKKNTVMFFSVFQGLGLLFLLPVCWGNTEQLWGYAAITVYFFSFSPLITALYTIGMDKAAKHNSPATDTTIQNTIFLLFAFLGATVTMNLAEIVGYAMMIIIGTVISVTVGFCAKYLLNS